MVRMRAICKGSISFGLVNIPIALYPATRRLAEPWLQHLIGLTDKIDTLQPTNHERS
jgi:DNA end-binding protein Ku